MLKGLFDKGKCALGFHAGPWQYEAEGSCDQVQICERCQKASRRTEHTWGEWAYAAADSCELERVCQRCRARETDLKHEWGDWYYRQEGNCQAVQVCTRCQAAGAEQQTFHQWGEWVYNESYRAPVSACRRCGEGRSAFEWQTVGTLATEAPRSQPAPHAARPERVDVPSSRLSAPAGMEVDEIVLLFQSQDIDKQRRFIAACSQAASLPTALKAIDAGLPEMALNFLATFYSHGADTAFAQRLAHAAWLIATQAQARQPEESNLYNAGQAALNRAVSLSAAGNHREVIPIAQEALDWLAGQPVYPQQAEHTAALRYCQAQAYFDLAEYEQAGAILEQSDWSGLELSYRTSLESLKQNYQRTVQQSATRISTEIDPDQANQQARRRILEQITLLRGLIAEGGVPAEIDAQLKEILAHMEEVYNDPDPEAWQRTDLDLEKMIMQVMGIQPAQFDLSQNRYRMHAAMEIFQDPLKGRDPQAIAQSAQTLLESLDWARQNGFLEDENVILWGLYVCYNRTDQLDKAAEVLTALRANLEGQRARITDPLERAGVFNQYPFFFPALCSVLYRLGDGPGLLEAIEGAKGRVIADVLTQKRGEAVSDQLFSAPIRRLPEVMGKLGAYYLTYLVDDEETFAALAARDGSIHIAAIPLGKAALRDLAKNADPKTWKSARAGLFGAKASNLPDQLSPLVDWLSPLLDAGVLVQGDHLCCCPDESLHLLPLSYIHFQGKPLVETFSLSRTQSALSVIALDDQPPARPERYTAVQVNAVQDQGDPAKLADFAGAPEWLRQHLKGYVMEGADGSLDFLTRQNLSGRVLHFATHGTFPIEGRVVDGRDANPFSGSGLLLAFDGKLPDLQVIVAGQGMEHLLTPQKALDLNLAGSHVTLQACVSGLAREGIGGDALGLEWALIQAGAASLLAAHWDISAGASAEFSRRFYQKWLVENKTRAVAWRESVLELKQTHPSAADWAPFSLSGDWR